MLKALRRLCGQPSGGPKRRLGPIERMDALAHLAAACQELEWADRF